MKLLIVYNPHAACGRSVKKLAAIKARFRSLGINATYLSTEYAGHGRELVAKTELPGFDGLVAAGGDGTVFEVLNGLYQHPKSARVPLGLLPLGTGNAFSRELTTQTDILTESIDLLAQGRTRQVDVGFVQSADSSYYFLNIVSMGFAVDAGQVALKMKFLGKTAYTLATLWQVLKLKSYPLLVEIDGEPVSSDNVFATFSNSRYTGTNFLIAPAARIDDGLLDVTILERLPRLRLLKLFPSIFSGSHVEYNEVSTYQASRVKIFSPPGFMLGPDGEFYGSTPAEISCLPGDLAIFC